jgi:hypothetical protein
MLSVCMCQAKGERSQNLNNPLDIMTDASAARKAKANSEQGEK